MRAAGRRALNRVDRKNDGEQIPVLTYSIQTNVFRRRHDSMFGKIPTCEARRLNSRFIRSIRFEVVIIRIGMSLKFINVKVSITDRLSFTNERIAAGYLSFSFQIGAAAYTIARRPHQSAFTSRTIQIFLQKHTAYVRISFK